MFIYLSVEVHDDGRVEPNVHVMSTTPGSFMSGGAALVDIDLDTVRRGVTVTTEVLDFAERIKREAWEVAG